jgi:hypothetical protein
MRSSDTRTAEMCSTDTRAAARASGAAEMRTPAEMASTANGMRRSAAPNMRRSTAMTSASASASTAFSGTRVSSARQNGR